MPERKIIFVTVEKEDVDMVCQLLNQIPEQHNYFFFVVPAGFETMTKQDVLELLKTVKFDLED